MVMFAPGIVPAVSPYSSLSGLPPHEVLIEGFGDLGYNRYQLQY